MKVHAEISFNDLSFEKKEELIEWVKTIMLEEWKDEGRRYIVDKKWHVKPKTWQEAFCRIEDIDWDLWCDLDEKSEEFQTYDWDYAITLFAEGRAEDSLYEAFRHLEVEIEI